MKNHVNIIAILHIVFGILPILIFGCIKLVLNQFAYLIEEPDVRKVLDIVFRIILWFIISVNIPGIVAGIGLLEKKNWARILTFIVSALRVFSFPLGTALAVYSFIVLVDREVIDQSCPK